MKYGRRIRVLVISGWCFLALSLVAGSYFVFIDAFAKSQGALTVTEAKYDDGVRTLPAAWRERGGPGMFRRSFTIDFTVEDPTGAELFLHVPFFEQRLELKLNGSKIYDSAQIRPWVGPISSLTALAYLPPPELIEGENSIEMIVMNGPAPVGAISPVLIGTKRQLERLYLVRRYLNETIPPIIFGLEVFVAFASLIVFALRPQDKIFGWLGMMMAAVTAIAFFGLSNLIPLVKPYARYATAIVPFGGIGLFGFARMLSGREVSARWFPVSIALSILLFLGIYLGISPGFLGFYAVIPALALCIAASLFYLANATLRDPRLEVVLFSIGLLIVAAGTLNDLMMRSGYFSNGIFLAQITRVVPLTAIAIFIVRHQSSIADALDASATTLKETLREKENELHQYYQAQHEMDQAKTLVEERLRITADLHDGVAGHLATIAALSEQTPPQTETIKQTSRNALLDLRMIIDALSVPNGDLMFYLGLFRDRCVDPLAALGVEINWSMTKLPETDTVSRESALNVMRILQEAVNNALRHGDLKKLSIVGKPSEDGGIEISVVNTSGEKDGPEDHANSSGIGLVSMQNRAEALGGRTEFHKTATGAELRLFLPSLGRLSLGGSAE